MAKPIIHVGIVVSVDGCLPGRSNILNICATTGSHNFNQNILPEYGMYKPSKFWEKFPFVFDEFKKSPDSYKIGIGKFNSWVKNFQGNLVACASSVDFWHLFMAMMEVCGECPFGHTPLDVNSYLAGMDGFRSPKRFKNIVQPMDLAKLRLQSITGGEQLQPTMTPKKTVKPAPLPPMPEFRELRLEDYGFRRG